MATGRKTYWAAFAGSALGQEITLHRTEQEALDAVVAALGLEEHEDEEDDRAVCDMDEEELREFLDDWCSARADDWCVDEVEVPE